MFRRRHLNAPLRCATLGMEIEMVTLRVCDQKIDHKLCERYFKLRLKRMILKNILKKRIPTSILENSELELY